jgi:hypothetical protein
VARHDQVGGDEAASGSEQSLDQRGRDGEQRVGDDPERLSRKSQIGRVGLDDLDAVVGEAVSELSGSAGVQLDRDDARASPNERRGQCAGPRADVENEIAAVDVCCVDKPARRLFNELMPTPMCRPCRGHGAPSPLS